MLTKDQLIDQLAKTGLRRGEIPRTPAFLRAPRNAARVAATMSHGWPDSNSYGNPPIPGAPEKGPFLEMARASDNLLAARVSATHVLTLYLTAFTQAS